MITLFDDRLYEIDRSLRSTPPREVPRLLARVPLDVFGELLLDVPAKFPNIKAMFPSMPPDEVQDHWTGSHGCVLLAQSVAFIKTLASGYAALTGRNLEDAVVLDYGCGWGRLIRLLYKFVPWESIYAVDPWNDALELCKTHNVRANLAMSDEVPRTLPLERQFDLIYAFSVFTHLSEKTVQVVLTTLRQYVADSGLLVMTIRPKEYWYQHDQGKLAPAMIEAHDKRGFAFTPHSRPPIDGDITFGKTSMSLDYVPSHFPQWRLAGVDYNIVDPMQVVVFLQPA